ncbi:MAG: hypothetical protein KC620_21270 [Myxococcales bacterium]|nr:hypothetical protein [Myxococcales bacterium]
MKTALLALAFVLLPPLLAQARPSVAIGQSLPRVVLNGEDEGQMQIKGDDINYVPFDSEKAIPGKVRMVTYMAGRRSAKALGQKLIDALNAEKWPANFQTITLMDLDDCTFGTCGIARGKLEDRQREKPAYIYVIDEEGKGRKRWGLQSENFTVFITDTAGKVTYISEGQINADGAKAVLEAIRAALAASGQ